MSILIRCKIVKIRKDRQCFGCLEKILAGSEVPTETYIGEDGPYTLYFCEECWRFMNENRILCADYEGVIREGWIGDERCAAAKSIASMGG